MNYQLTTNDNTKQGDSPLKALRTLGRLLLTERTRMLLALVALLANSGLTIWAPIVLGHGIDKHLVVGDYTGVLWYTGYLAAMYVGAAILGYIQTRIMGGVAQRVLYGLRNRLFTKLQELPIAFFNQNKAGDLISRINNDTDKLNQFFSQSLMQLVGNAFVIIGSGIAMVIVNDKLGAVTLLPAVGLLLFTQLTARWIKRRNLTSLQSLGGMSAEVQESLENFRIIVAYNRRDYFRERFSEVNNTNYDAAVSAGIATNTLTPVYNLASNLGQLIVVVYGLYLITHGSLTFGLLVSYMAYANRFYHPLRQMASIWANLQAALAGWDRISEILAMESNLVTVPGDKKKDDALLEFDNVAFAYPGGAPVLKDVSFTFKPGKTYAFVGPTGGGKTTTASLIARLYDPTEGVVRLHGKDIRSYSESERAAKIGFILQDPYLFNGTVADNLLYGHPTYTPAKTDLKKVLKQSGLDSLLTRFDKGLETPVSTSGDGLSLGQRQLIAFMRAVLRNPELLILDEATANVDTVTEQLLEEILSKLPKSTTRVVIAHRLNTIANADEIYFVNRGTVTKAGSYEHALSLLTSGQRTS